MYNILFLILGLNVEFVKRLTVILNRVFAGLSNLIPDFNIACQWNRVIDKINHNIRVYEVNILNKQVCFNNSSDINIQANNLLKEKDLSNENKIPKKTCYSNLNMNTISLISQQKKPKNQNMESLKRVVLDTENIKIHGHQQYNSEQLAYNYQPKIPKLMTVDEENANPGITKTLIVISSFNRTYFPCRTILSLSKGGNKYSVRCILHLLSNTTYIF